MRVLDLFCGAGGAAMGIHRAWPNAQIVGVDLVPQPRYPFQFVRGDALRARLDAFDFVWASPPCQGYSSTRTIPDRDEIPRAYLVEAIRDRLLDWGGNYIIENVPGAPLLDPITLCGVPLGLRVFRHRLFESNQKLVAPPHQKHVERTETHNLATYNNRTGSMVTVAGHLFSLKAGSFAMGIDWMTRAELAQAIPPAYSEYLTRQLT